MTDLNDSLSPPGAIALTQGLLMAATLAPPDLPSPSTPAGVATLAALEPFCDAPTRIRPVLDSLSAAAKAAWFAAAHARLSGRPRSALKACIALQRLAPGWFAAACLAETESLLGDPDAHDRLRRHLLLAPVVDPASGQWIHSMQARMALRLGLSASADTHLRLAVGLSAFGCGAAPALRAASHAVAALADHLIATRRPDEALGLLLAQQAGLAEAPLSLQVRFVVACHAVGSAARAAQADGRLRQAFEAGAAATSASAERAQALHALAVDKDAVRALDWALDNWRGRRDIDDADLLARCAAAAGRSEVLVALRALMQAWQWHPGAADRVFRSATETMSARRQRARWPARSTPAELPRSGRSAPTRSPDRQPRSATQT